MAEEINLKTTLSGLVDIQEKTLTALSTKYYNKTMVDTKVKVLSGLTDEVLSGFNDRLEDLEVILDNM
jgi:hypothetical protein